MVQAKDPRQVDAGRRGARRRWGEQRIVRLDTLPPTVAHVIRQLVSAAEAANEKAVTVSETPVTATQPEGTSDASAAAA